MKSFFLVLLYVSALCITSNAVYYNNRGQPLLTNDNDPDSMCYPVVVSEQCINGLFQEYANMAPYYGYPAESRSAHDACFRDYMGTFCGAIDNNMLETDAETVCKNFTSSCSEECRDLVVRARSELGCCVNIFNSSDYILYAYKLWTSCGVDLVTQECLPSTITLPQITPPRYKDVIPFFTHQKSIFCRRQYVEYIRDRLSTTEGCRDYSYPRPGDCNANGKGTYCDLLLFGPDNFTAASESCNDTSTCDPHCIETLNNITSTIGCCINYEYNRTEVDWMSYEFWSMCGLNSPGNCEQRLNNDSPFDPPLAGAAVVVRASSIAIAFAVTIAAMLLWNKV